MHDAYQLGSTSCSSTVEGDESGAAATAVILVRSAKCLHPSQFFLAVAATAAAAVALALATAAAAAAGGWQSHQVGWLETR